jgi:hypothetical protein
MIYASINKGHQASFPIREVRPTANIVSEPYCPSRLNVRPIREANINAVLTQELVQFQLLAAKTNSVPNMPGAKLSPVCTRPHSILCKE